MTDLHSSAPTDDVATARLRKADVWTGGVLAVVALLMIGQALTFPLEGTYAGVRNAWYVSPALLPLAIGTILLALSVGLLLYAARDYRRLNPDGRLLAFNLTGGGGEARTAWLTAIVLTAYVVGIVPRVDFIIGTALFLIVFMGVAITKNARLRLALIAALVVVAAAAFVIDMVGIWPPPRSPGQFTADWIVLGVVVATVLLVLVGGGAERRQLRTAAVTALVFPVLTALAFKDGLLIPLPRDGLGTATLETIVRGASRLFG